MIEEFDRLAREPIGDPYNRGVGQDFEDRDRWELPLCAGLHYFDLMVSEALYQGVQWHMWLFVALLFSALCEAHRAELRS